MNSLRLGLIISIVDTGKLRREVRKPALVWPPGVGGVLLIPRPHATCPCICPPLVFSTSDITRCLGDPSNVRFGRHWDHIPLGHLMREKAEAYGGDWNCPGSGWVTRGVGPRGSPPLPVRTTLNLHPINFAANHYILSCEPCAFNVHVLSPAEVRLNPLRSASLRAPLNNLDGCGVFVSLQSLPRFR